MRAIAPLVLAAGALGLLLSAPAAGPRARTDRGSPDGVRADGARTPLDDPVLRLARHRDRMNPATWAELRRVVARRDLDEPQLAKLRAVLAEVLRAAAKPGAPYGGGADAIAIAAAVGDTATLLRLVCARETVIRKLPLTTARDDLAFLDHALGAICARGTRRQRAALAREVAAALRDERDPDARRLWLEYETRLGDES